MAANFSVLQSLGLTNRDTDYIDYVGPEKKEMTTVAYCYSFSCAGARNAGVKKYVWETVDGLNQCKECHYPVKLKKERI